MHLQKTLKSTVKISGIGLHTGQSITVTLVPALPNHGITFSRTDLKNSQKLSAHHQHITGTQLATTLTQGQVSIGTIEHLMAALAGLSIDNVSILINGPEVPILDGSAFQFADAILKAGIETQLAPRTFLAITRKVEVRVNEKWAVVEPSSNFEIESSIEWDHPCIGFQDFHYVEGKTEFSEIASARTFGFVHEVEALRKMGLARGGSLENAVVLDRSRILNEEGLRFSNEFVRHKVLDAVGDFKLAGMPMLGKFRLHRAGHDLHARLVGAILESTKNYELVSSTRPEKVTAQEIQNRFFKPRYATQF